MGWKQTKRYVDSLRQRWLGDFRASDQPGSKLELHAHGFLPIDECMPADVFLVGFPKSGNTWMQNLVAGMLFGMDTRLLTDQLTQTIVPNVHGLSCYKRLGEKTFFKSHALPRPEYRRVVYLVRDGRDALVSYFHMLNAVAESPIELCEMVDDGTGLFPGKWHEHVQAWHENPFNAELIVIRYEDLHANPLREMERLCEFAGLVRDVELLERSIEGNSFSQMQKKEARYGWDNRQWNPEDQFVRRGIIGSYKDEMPTNLIHRFEEQSGEQLKLHGYPLSVERGICRV